ncbi:hypothetical protein OH76DRAFT_28852 [Lentinus brumalis]|uniref:Uncharacterized protein n=1 Tax=Lentinus brumalis TaxID=2498619 RepID=A0A371DXT4_9APHY|nr:hypothetical protein OH76DRAFT_28852 [Polyporus brumalis]
MRMWNAGGGIGSPQRGRSRRSPRLSSAGGQRPSQPRADTSRVLSASLCAAGNASGLVLSHRLRPSLRRLLSADAASAAITATACLLVFIVAPCGSLLLAWIVFGRPLSQYLTGIHTTAARTRDRWTQPQSVLLASTAQRTVGFVCDAS